MFAAAKAHRRYDIDPTRRVDVFEAISKAGIILAFRPLKQTSGAYLASPVQPGIIINSNHPPSRQRFSAAHELGHHFLNHKTKVDWDSKPADREYVPSDEQEMMAEAFASWFLMPKTTVEYALNSLGLEFVVAPEEAYQLALRLGTSFEATIRQLLNLRYIAPASAKEWLALGPAQIKESIGHTWGLPPSNMDVWKVRHSSHESPLFVRQGDRVVIEFDDRHSGSDWHVISTRGSSPIAVVRDPETASPSLLRGLCRSDEPLTPVLAVDISKKTSSDSSEQCSLIYGQRNMDGTLLSTFSVAVNIQPTTRLGISESYFGEP